MDEEDEDQMNESSGTHKSGRLIRSGTGLMFVYEMCFRQRGRDVMCRTSEAYGELAEQIRSSTNTSERRKCVTL